MTKRSKGALGIVRAVAAACAAHAAVAAEGQLVNGPALATDIAAQPVAQALERFELLTGLHVVYVSKDVANKSAHRAEAGLDPQAALVRLLRGTQLDFEFLNDRTVRIVAAPPRANAAAAPEIAALAEIIVTANRHVERLADTPMTVVVLTAEKLAQLHVSNFDDYLALVPGLTAHSFGPGESNLIIRGLATHSGGKQA
jgi:TonB-dependent Receptor Plug Domain